MKKTLLASAIALSVGSATSVQALTISITVMNFNGVHSASGTMNDAGTGSMTDTTVPGFFGTQWTADQVEWFDTHSSVTTWAGGTSTGAIGAFSYTFHLTGNQVAAGTFFDWSTSFNIPVLTIYDCNSGTCLGNSLPMAAGPFPTQQPAFNGTTLDEFPVSGSVPVPAAVWLMGSGLLGLVGVARRRKVA